MGKGVRQGQTGIPESQRGRRLKDRDLGLILDLFIGDIVRLSVPYGEPAVELLEIVAPE